MQNKYSLCLADEMFPFVFLGFCLMVLLVYKGSDQKSKRKHKHLVKQQVLQKYFDVFLTLRASDIVFHQRKAPSARSK